MINDAGRRQQTPEHQLLDYKTRFRTPRRISLMASSIWTVFFIVACR
jgi:hypothetical protein